MKVFAHRGASGTYPENTLPAIAAALEANADGIELDIQSCLDDLVVLHDSWLDRTTSGQGKVSEFTYQQLALLDAGDGNPIPTLDSVFALVKQQTMLNLELKHVGELRGFIACLERNLESGLINQQQLLVSSFNHPMLKALKQQLPWLKIGALTASIPLDHAAFASQLDAYSVHVDKDFVSAEFIADAKQRGLKVYAYTVDKQKDIDYLKAIGVDGIFSNYPCQTKMYLSI
ncbi:glycerophosphodiester phosphodiesterase [Pseudoalteromonas fenneropenaei]|uniref:Glycerophosphodiester phosphodiesterase n=1 Tax=Pseudoalteromonas fenneropenaei TaxID=1737459 RepID=A0ABV7CLS0_9GAMM